MLDTETLERVAQDGEMDYEKWPAILEPLLERLNQIVFEFPTPRPYQNISSPQNPPSQSTTNHIEPAEVLGANGAQVPATPLRPLPPVPAFDSSSTSTSHVPESAPNSQPAPALSQIPVLLEQMLNSIQSTLRSCFSQNPPHTIQRLAELVLYPNKHYKTLPAWLRAVDRVVAVSSTADIFPLPHAQPLPNSVIDASLLNGTSNNEESEGTGTGTGGGGILWDNSRDRANGIDAGLGSDESLGGALLTPIPWLKDGQGMSDSNNTEASTATDDSSDSEMLIVPDREHGAVTQGELIRQEQEAGVIPVSSIIAGQSRMMSGARETGSDDVMVDEELEDPIPHARGPGIVGTVDMGLVGGRGVEVSIDSGEQRLQEDKTGVVSDAQTVLEQGRPKEGQDGEMQVDAAAPSDSEDDAGLTEPASDAGATQEDEDGDMVLADVDRKKEEQQVAKAADAAEHGGPDASDTTAL